MRHPTGQVAWITGAGTNIGESAALKLAEFGCTVVVSGRRREPLESLIEGISALTGPAYISAKHAMNAMTASLLLEERNNGIRANVVCPGEVGTPILDQRRVPVTDEDRARMLQPRISEISCSSSPGNRLMSRCTRS